MSGTDVTDVVVRLMQPADARSYLEIQAAAVRGLAAKDYSARCKCENGLPEVKNHVALPKYPRRWISERHDDDQNG